MRWGLIRRMPQTTSASCPSGWWTAIRRWSGAEDKPLDGCGDTGRAEGLGEAGGAVGGGVGGGQSGVPVLQGGGGGAVAGARLAEDGSPHLAVAQERTPSGRPTGMFHEKTTSWKWHLSFP